MAYNKITLHGGQICDYLYVQSNEIDVNDFSYVNSEPPDEWKDETLLFANFKDEERRLSAGNSAIIGNIEGYRIYRKKYDNSQAEYIGTVKKNDNENNNDIIIDYSVTNRTDYCYYLYPNFDKTYGGAALTPIITQMSALNCNYWSLMIVDETEEENIFYLDKLFKFELNLEVGTMSNNAQITVTQNFTQYPTLQYGASNYWSGTLSSICGFISSNCVDYVQTNQIINELKAISSDPRRKFLKDIEGNLWEVAISAPIDVSTNYIASKSIKSWTFSWVEVGDAKGISIINNPELPVTSWILTETGQAVPYISYVWGEEYIWNNSHLWTSNRNSDKVRGTHLMKTWNNGDEGKTVKDIIDDNFDALGTRINELDRRISESYTKEFTKSDWNLGTIIIEYSEYKISNPCVNLYIKDSSGSYTEVHGGYTFTQMGIELNSDIPYEGKVVIT